MKDVVKRSIGTAIGMTAGLLIYDQIKKSRSYQRLVIGQSREKRFQRFFYMACMAITEQCKE